jgi:cation transport ATPase
MDESHLTGEPFLIAKVPGSDILSGAVIGESALTVSVTNLPMDSRYAKIMRVMPEAEANRPRIRRIADRLGAWYTVPGVGLAALGWAISHDFTRFLAVLVIATPCPLLLAIPVAIIGAISMAASRAIIIKKPAMLERIGSCRTVIFDKTGTLTNAKPSLTVILCAANVTRRRALEIGGELEQYSKHPLAASVLASGPAGSYQTRSAVGNQREAGTRIEHSIDGSLIQITGRRSTLHQRESEAPQLPPVAAGMECILLIDGRYARHFGSTTRRESRSFIHHLAAKHQVKKVMLVSDDRETEVRYLAGEVVISEVLFGKGPEEKVEIVCEEAKKGPTCFWATESMMHRRCKPPL